MQSEDERLVGRLVRWNDLRRKGQPVCVEELCRDCPELLGDLQQQIEALLAMDGVLDTSIGTVTFRPDEPLPWPLPGFPGSGELADAYEILGILGHGGMGVVYKAKQRRLKRIVALKMIGEGSRARPDQRVRFLIEAEAVARLRHPNVVAVYDFGEAEGHPFVTLEWLEGGSLADRLKGTTWPGRAAAELVATLAGAMHAAHQAGIVHRDLKPSNILFDADGVPKIADFGLAKRLEVEDGQTRSGQVMGTPSYMAPEQARGHVREVGPAADVYGLEATLYEMLTGRPPFKAPSTLEMLHQVIFDDVIPPSRLQVRLARDLQTICLKCLAKEPTRRYPSALALAEDLERWLRGEPIAARSVGRIERVGRWCRRNPLIASLGAAVVALSILGVGGLAAGNVAIARQNLAIARQRDEARDQRQKADQNAAVARRERDNADWNLYLADMKLAHQAWDDADIGRMHELLDIHRPRPGRPDNRGWEWHYLAALTHHDRRTIPVDPDGADALAWSPDGKQVAAAGADGRIILWDAASGTRAGVLDGHAGPLTALAWNSDGTRLAAVGAARALLWDVGKRELIFEFSEPGIIMSAVS
jgi:tRNA A-37 threonylcarbamoyl transferase component Bud32